MPATELSGMRKWEREGAEYLFAVNGRVPVLLHVCQLPLPIRVQSMKLLSFYN